MRYLIIVSVLVLLVPCCGNEDVPTCGNGIIDPGETCDGDCPMRCDDGNPCTIDSMIGSAATCTAECEFQMIRVCFDGDGCCGAGCNSSSDNDCLPDEEPLPEVLYLHIADRTPTSIKLDWDAPTQAAVDGYRIAFGSVPPDDCLDGPNIIHDEAIESTSFLIEVLEPETDYGFRVCTVKRELVQGGEVTRVSEGVTISGTTMSHNPDEVGPLALLQLGEGVGTIQVTWASVVGASSYLWTSLPDEQVPPEGCDQGQETTSTLVAISNLELNRRINIRVCALNPLASEPVTPGSVGSLVVLGHAPVEVTANSISDITSTSAVLSWALDESEADEVRIALNNDGQFPDEQCVSGNAGIYSVQPSVLNQDFTGLDYLSGSQRTTFRYRICTVSAGVIPRVSTGRTGTFHLHIPEDSDFRCDPTGRLSFLSYGTQHEIELTVEFNQEDYVSLSSFNCSGTSLPRRCTQNIHFCNEYSGGVCYSGYPPFYTDYTITVISEDEDSATTMTRAEFTSPMQTADIIYNGSCNGITTGL